MAKQVIGIHLEMENESTGAITAFHTMRSITLDFQAKTCTVIIASYVSEKMYQKGRNPVNYGETVVLFGIPERGIDAVDWAYRQLVAPIEAGALNPYGQPIEANVFTGATLVEQELNA